MVVLKQWQRHRGLTDDMVARTLGVSRPTWIKWRDSGCIPHDKLIFVVNLLQVPHDDAKVILMGGYK